MSNPHITIRLTPDGFSFSDGDTWQHIDVPAGPDFASRLADAVLTSPLAASEADNMTCEVCTTRFVALPPETDDDEADAMMRVTLSQASESENHFSELVSLAYEGHSETLKIRFAVNSEICAFLRRNFGDVTFTHPLGRMLREAYADAAEGSTLVVSADSDALLVACFAEGRPTLLNLYPTHKADHRNYYVMNTWLQSDMDQLNDTLLVVGHNAEALQLCDDLQHLIRNIKTL